MSLWEDFFAFIRSFCKFIIIGSALVVSSKVVVFIVTPMISLEIEIKGGANQMFKKTGGRFGSPWRGFSCCFGLRGCCKSSGTVSGIGYALLSISASAAAFKDFLY